jgi:hypothetical protein
MLGFLGSRNKKKKIDLGGTGIDPNAVTIKPYKSKAILKAASKKKRPNDKQTEKQKAQKSRKLSENKVVSVNTTFTLNPPTGSIGIFTTTYNVTIQMKGDVRVISQEKKKVKAKEPEGDLSAKYKYHINKLLLEHIDLTKDGINDTKLGKKHKQIKLLKKIQKAKKPNINADIVKWLTDLDVKVTLTGTKESKTATGEVVTKYYSKMKNLTDLPGVNDYITSKKMKKLRDDFKIQDDMSAEEYLGETLFLGLKF